jgi:hypothetical protein
MKKTVFLLAACAFLFSCGNAPEDNIFRDKDSKGFQMLPRIRP